mgnify:FL=1|tara:strand:+ start:163 stop:456 length:294 start_codon:yes stop_codon:yes gene_type:complete
MITNQKVIIEKWLHDHGSITHKQADRECGVSRLSAVIFELRKRGLDIETNTLAVKNRYGKTSYVAQYQIKGHDKSPPSWMEDFNGIVKRAMSKYRSV